MTQGSGKIIATLPLAAGEDRILGERIPVYSAVVLKAIDHIDRIFKGQNELVHHVMTSLIASGHILIEGVPGTGKTMLAELLRHTTGLEGKRIQFTPDLLPQDIIGTKEQRGPVFTEILLADELNRAGPKVQSALLQAMAEGKVTIDGHDFRLPRTFFVVATENPVEQEGTYPLPEAQKDRFLMKVPATYPSEEIEKQIAIEQTTSSVNLVEFFKLVDDGVSLESIPDPDAVRNEIPAVMTPNDVIVMQKLAAKIPLSKDFVDAATCAVRMTRPYLIDDPDRTAENTKAARELSNTLQGKKRVNDMVSFGAGTRALLAFFRASRARALIRGDGIPTTDDLNALMLPILEPRLTLHYNAENKRAQHIAEIVGDIKRTLSL